MPYGDKHIPEIAINNNINATYYLLNTSCTLDPVMIFFYFMANLYMKLLCRCYYPHYTDQHSGKTRSPHFLTEF